MNWKPAVYAVKLKQSEAMTLVGGMIYGPLGVHSEILNGRLHITHLKSGMKIGEAITSLYHATVITERLVMMFGTDLEQLQPTKLSKALVDGIFESVYASGVSITHP